MGETAQPKPVNLVCPVLAMRQEWFGVAEQKLREEFGPVDLRSDIWPFDFTDYYETEMGGPLQRLIYSFRNLVEPRRLPDIKLATNRMERELSRQLDATPARPVNLDPGYVSLSKLVLATTKDYAHRVYLGKGIYAESALRWRDGGFEPWPWTYPDYATDSYREFFARVRSRYRQKLAARQQ